MPQLSRRDPFPVPSHPSAHDMTAALARGDAAVFDLFYRTWFPKLLGLARRATGRDEAFALDVVQDAFVRIIRSPRVCPTDGELAAWLRACILSAAVDRLRAEARRNARERAEARGDPAVAPAETTEASERLAWLSGRLAELPATDRDLVRLRFDVQRSLAEIASASGDRSTWGSVQGRLRRTLDRLRTAASEYFA